MFAELLIRATPLSLMEKVERYMLGRYNLSKNMLAHSNPELLERISEKKALAVFHKAAKEIPAYQKFLRQRHFEISTVKNIRDFNFLIPETTKDNYVKKNKMEATFRGGVLPDRGAIEESSGSSGHPTNWVKDYKENRLLELEIDFESNYLFELPRKSIIISCWSPGPWATDLKFCEIFEHEGLVKNVGPDVNGVIELMKRFGTKYHYLIAGYPPFCRHLLEKTQKEVNWKKYKVDFVVGGEGFVIGWREHIKNFLNQDSKVFSAYGASDVNIGVAIETPFSVFIRDMLVKNKKLRETLCSPGMYPMIFQYNPLAYYIENVKRKNEEEKYVQEFTVTPLDMNVGSPKVKYNLHDEGRKLSFMEMKGLLEHYAPKEYRRYVKNTKIDIIHLPFLLVTGRSDGTISINGTNVYPQQVEIALMKDKKIFDYMHTFRISSSKEGKDQFVVKVELKKDLKNNKQLKEMFSKAVLRYLPEVSEEYGQALREFKNVFTPCIEVYEFDNGPFSGSQSKLKHKYID